MLVRWEVAGEEVVGRAGRGGGWSGRRRRVERRGRRPERAGADGAEFRLKRTGAEAGPGRREQRW